YAEFAKADQQKVFKLPDGMNFTVACGFFSAYGTSFHALVQRANLRKCEVLVVLGAAGGIGLAAIEIAKAMGAMVIGVSTGQYKLQVAKDCGADYVLDYNSQNLKEAI